MKTNKSKTEQRRKAFAVIIALIITASVYAQSASPRNYNQCTQFFLKNPVEKLYLNTDRDIYAENDTIWFKTYLVNAHTGRLDNALLRNVYVELIDQNNETGIRNMLAMKEGISFGDFVLTNYQIKKGKYKLRAYTNYQTNFGDAFLFEKNILVTPVFEGQSYNVFHDSIETAEAEVYKEQPSIDLQFLPEGGYFTSDLSNNLAFKAVNCLGYGVNIEGAIYESDATKVADFSSTYLGMGTVSFKPEKGKTYYAKLNSDGTRYPLPAATEMLMMKVANDYPDSLITVTLRANTITPAPAIYYLLITSKGIVRYSAKVPVTTAYKKIKIPYSEFSMGINQVTLLDSSLTPLHDRLVFVDKGEKLNVDITTDKASYHPFDSVAVTIHATTPNGLPAQGASLSVSVTDQSLSKPLSENKENIFTWLLMESDLKGEIEQPASYFNKNDSTANDRLDLLMLTQGWSQYVWDPIFDSIPEIKHSKQYGIEMTGELKRTSTEKAMKNTLLTMSMMQGDELYYDTINTDTEGRFSISNMVIPDSLEVYFACPDKKNREQEVDIQTFAPQYPVGTFTNFPLPGKTKLEAFTIQATNRFIDDKTIHPEKYEVFLDEITVSKKIDQTDIKDDHIRPYVKADKAFVPAETDISYQNILYYLSRQMGRVKYYGNSTLSISGMPGGGSSSDDGTPMLLIDGMEVELIDMEVLPMSVVDKVEVLSDPTSLSIWPSDSKAFRNGVISVFTKTANEYESYKNSQLAHILRGYYPSRKFYSPNYSAKKSIPKTDRRTTLLWAPVINTDENGNARFTFFNTNNKGKMKIEIEGMNRDGQTAVTSKEYEVQ